MPIGNIYDKHLGTVYIDPVSVTFAGILRESIEPYTLSARNPEQKSATRSELKCPTNYPKLHLAILEKLSCTYYVTPYSG